MDTIIVGVPSVTEAGWAVLLGSGDSQGHEPCELSNNSLLCLYCTVMLEARYQWWFASVTKAANTAIWLLLCCSDGS